MIVSLSLFLSVLNPFSALSQLDTQNVIHQHNMHTPCVVECLVRVSVRML